MNIQIKSRFTNAVLFEGEAADLKDLLVRLVKGGANLEGANLEGANLRGADLWGANLEGANLRGANLEGANLRGANLEGANLWGANLRGANLEGANLRGADLEGANLWGANLRGAKVDGEEIKIAPLAITGLRYWALITDNYLRLGCKRFTHSEWANFSDSAISSMDHDALAFWSEWKQPILAMCKSHANKAFASTH